MLSNIFNTERNINTFQIGDVVSYKDGLYVLKDNHILKDKHIIEDVCGMYKIDRYKDSDLKNYNLQLIKTELASAYAKGIPLKFHIMISKKNLPIFINKVQNLEFNLNIDDIEKYNKFYFLFEKCGFNDYKCSLYDEISLIVYRLNHSYVCRLNEERLTDLKVSYIVFNSFDADYRFEVNTVDVQAEVCNYNAPRLSANVCLMLGDNNIEDELLSYLYKENELNKYATIHYDNANNLRLSQLVSINNSGYDYFNFARKCLNLSYANAEYITSATYYYSFDNNKQTLKSMIYGNWGYEEDSITTATAAVEKAEHEYRLKQKYKELGLDKIDIDSLFEGIDYSYKPDNQDFVTFNKSDVELQYKMYNKEKEKEKEKNMIILKNGFKSTKELKQIVINEGEGIVTAVAENISLAVDGNKKSVTMAKTSNGDEFDKYVGAALAIAYQLFGSKTQFKKYVDENAKEILKPKKNKEDVEQKEENNKVETKDEKASEKVNS